MTHSEVEIGIAPIGSELPLINSTLLDRENNGWQLVSVDTRNFAGTSVLWILQFTPYIF